MTGARMKKLKSNQGKLFRRNCGKQLRTSIVNLHHILQRPQLSTVTVCLGFLIVTGTILILCFVPWFRFGLGRGNARHEFYASINVRDTENDSAFTEEACGRKYDSVWSIRKDDGKDAWRKDKVRISYFVQIGNDSVELLPRLFARIHHPENVYVVHVDKKVDEQKRIWVQQLIERNAQYNRNMHVLESEMVTYKAISMVTNTMSAMTLALEKDAHWDYFINLSGADYPLVSPVDQMRLLARPRVPIGRLNFVTFFPKKEWLPYSFRVRNMHWDPAVVGHQSPNNRLRLLRGLKENPLEKHRAYDFTKAEAWMILSRPFVQFLVRSAFAKKMLVNHLHVLSVPEHYFADILYNHPFWRTTIVPDALRKVVWYLRNRRSGQHPYILDKGPTPFTWWEYIAETSSLFARKFSVPDAPIMDRIDATMTGTGLNHSDAKYTNYAVGRKVFYDRIVAHFDQITQTTLEHQGYRYPRNAYPKT